MAAEQPRKAFAGRRKSGIGGADGKHGLYEYTETQVAYIQHG